MSNFGNLQRASQAGAVNRHGRHGQHGHAKHDGIRQPNAACACCSYPYGWHLGTIDSTTTDITANSSATFLPASFPEYFGCSPGQHSTFSAPAHLPDM